MKKCLITGIAGFVGNYLREEVLRQDRTIELHGVQRSGERIRDKKVAKSFHSHELDIRDSMTVSNLIEKIQPDVVYHLAAQPFVPKAILDPWGTLDINVKGTLNILEALRKVGKHVRMVYVSSADVYGKQDPKNMPLREDTIPNPVNPYSASKLSAETYCRQFTAYAQNIEVMIARPFNHIGVGQRLEFVVPNFCSQIASSIKNNESTMMVGDLSSTRDFLDVQDVVRAYTYLAQSGLPGEVYNICSGQEISIQDVLEKIIKIANANVTVKIDPERIRPVETPRLFGDNHKLNKLGWKPEITLDASLSKIYSWINSL
ncbi:MAG: GDP-mannose 4,6-dehydratase [Leptospira sp.]|nr:GDP-mannose 4,6-dehydratase [Leptospira sp.]